MMTTMTLAAGGTTTRPAALCIPTGANSIAPAALHAHSGTWMGLSVNWRTPDGTWIGPSAGKRTPANAQWHSQTASIRLAGMKILLLEDDSEIGAWVRDGLVRTGHVVDWLESGKDALVAATMGEYDVLVLDRMVPELDGLSVLKALRSARVATPALILTALGDVDDRVEGLQSGADDYLPKPFAFSELGGAGSRTRPPEHACSGS